MADACARPPAALFGPLAFPVPAPARQDGLAGQGFPAFGRYPLPARLCGLAGDFPPALRRQPGSPGLPALFALSDEIGALPWGQAEFHGLIIRAGLRIGQLVSR